MPSPIFISNPPPGFSLIAIVRGVQLGLLGAYRSLQNPQLFQTMYYKQAISAVMYSVALQLLLWMPIVALKMLFRVVSFVFRDLSETSQSVVTTLAYFQHNILNLSIFVISALRFFKPELDELFLLSLQFVDQVYEKKHPDREPHQYYANLIGYTKVRLAHHTPAGKKSLFDSLWNKLSQSQDFTAFLNRYLRNCLFSLAVYTLCRIPKLGSVVVGVISFSNFNNVVGTVPAVAVFLVLQLLPTTYKVLFLTIYWGSRSMIHDLLLPYFIRIQLTKIEKEQWIKSREGVLFGFGLCYFTLIYYLPWIGILIYGFAESSAAFLVTKVSDSPPEHANQIIDWNATQLVWNKDKENYILSGLFSKQDEGFTPIPGSFMLDPKQE